MSEPVDRERLERMAKAAGEDGLAGPIAEVLKGVLHAPGPYGDKTRENIRVALTELDRHE